MFHRHIMYTDYHLNACCMNAYFPNCSISFMLAFNLHSSIACFPRSIRITFVGKIEKPSSIILGLMHNCNCASIQKA
uniref:Uncharacterized protein n=1 Tax=Rhizophora mucronata TaxID=61149 RepID=A0A2P2IWJ1_RHIMU